jgi:hypothetical protein
MLLFFAILLGAWAQPSAVQIAARSESAIMGAFVADNAVMGLHWVYDVSEIAGSVGSSNHPEWHTPPASKYYAYDSGQQTPYGEEFSVLLSSMGAQIDGGLDLAHFGKTFLQYCHSGCQEERCPRARLNGMARDFCRVCHGMDSSDESAWSTKCAADNGEAHSLVKVPVLVARCVVCRSRTCVA